MDKNNELFVEISKVLSDGQQLPAPCYVSQPAHTLDIDKIFSTGWIAVGFASRYADKNHSWSIEVMGKPILITRDQNSRLHVFNNVCRHRGHLLQEMPTQNKRILSCPYHAWCYGLDGHFIKAPFWDGTARFEPCDAQKSTMGLIPIKFEIWYDIIFLDLFSQAGSFQEFVDPLTTRWAQQPAELLHRFSFREFSIQGNWKLVAENFLDNYHLPWIHPEIGSSLQGALGLDGENMFLSKDIIGFSHPSAGEDKDKTTVPLPSWPNRSDNDNQRQDLFFMFPNICFVLEGYYLWSMILLPTNVDSCDEQIALYVVGDDAMSDQFEQSRQQLEQVIYRINQQDENVIRNLQKGHQCDVATLGIYCGAHDQLGKWFHQIVARKLLNTTADRESDR